MNCAYFLYRALRSVSAIATLTWAHTRVVAMASDGASLRARLPVGASDRAAAAAAASVPAPSAVSALTATRTTSSSGAQTRSAIRTGASAWILSPIIGASISGGREASLASSSSSSIIAPATVSVVFSFLFFLHARLGV